MKGEKTGVGGSDGSRNCPVRTHKSEPEESLRKALADILEWNHANAI